MPDEPLSEPTPPDPQPAKAPRKRRRIVNLAEKPGPRLRDNFAIASLCLVLAGGATMMLIGGMSSGTRGARLSTKLKWELRQAELDDLASQAEVEGKLPPSHD